MRRWIALAGVVLLAVGPGCRPANRGPVLQVTRSPEFHPDSLKTVAFLGLGSSVPDPRAVPMMEPAMERALAAEKYRFVILGPDDAERRSRISGSEETYRAVRDYWRDSKKIDKFRAAELCRVLDVDAILIGTVVDWLQTDASASSTQNPSTKVIASLSLYPAGAGRPAWQAQASQTLEITGREGDSGDPYRRTVRQRELERSPQVQARGRGAEAPGFEEVVDIVAAELARALAS
jgi:hypothetical protein